MASVGQERRHSQTMNTAALAVFDCDGIIGISNGKIHALDRRSFFTKKADSPALPDLELPAIFLAENPIMVTNIRNPKT